MPNLEELQIQENELVSLAGLNDLGKLKKLNLNTNKLETLDNFPLMPCLEELILDANQITKVEDLQNLVGLRNLVELSMQGCPLSDEKGDDFKKEVLIAFEGQVCLKKINGEEFTAEDVQEAMALKEERIQEALNKPPEEEGDAAAAEEED